MSARWEGQSLLQPITADQPCGENLEDTPLLSSFDSLRLFGQSRSLEAPPDDKESRKPIEWGEIKTNATDALGKSKDLRLLAYLGTALLRTDGLPAFFETLEIASFWVETYWPYVYPPIDEDAIARRNALNCLADPMAVIERLRRVPLVQSRQHGSFSLRDIDLATGQMAPVKDEVKPEEAPINAAFTEMPLEALKDLQQAAADAMTALNNIDSRMKTEGGPEVAPSFDPLSAQLVKMGRFLRAQLALRPGDNGASPQADVAVDDAPQAGFSGGAIRSRQEAIRALDAVADFFRRSEPSSPVPLFIERAKRLVGKDFLEVLANIAPEALGVARAAGGLRDDN
jgi:type VI secretion system protein ImpA